MHLVTFKNSPIYWDKFQAFHTHIPARNYNGYGGTGVFVQFDTGELICTRAEPRPDERRLYKDLDVLLVSTKDELMPAVITPDGEPVCLAELNRGGQQMVLADYHTGRVVGIQHASRYHVSLQNGTGLTSPIPSRLRPHATVYFAGDSQPPIGSPIKVSRARKWSPEERAGLYAKVNAARAWVALHDGKEAFTGRLRRSEVLKRPFNQMTDDFKCALASAQFQTEHVVTEYPYLLLKSRD